MDPPEMGTWYLSTTRPDGRPHAAGVGGAWHDGDVYFTAGAGTRKARNLAHNPACVLSISLKGIDVVLEGHAERLEDPALVKEVIEQEFAPGWPAEVKGAQIVGPYNAPSAGPPPWDLYRFTFDTVFAVATKEPNGATRWRFG